MKEKISPGDKWCPMARVAVPCGEDNLQIASANRFPAGVGLSDYWLNARCLGERCAAYVGTDASGYCGLANR